MLVLASYVKHRGAQLSLQSSEIQDLAALLRRTPASILMRMENFASLDHTIERKGLINVSPACRDIFEEWINRPDQLHAVAEFLLAELRSPRQLGLFGSTGVRLTGNLSRYELLELIGQGGFGEVYSCIDRHTNGLFALKIVRGDKIQDGESIHRFAREMKALRAVDSPYIIRLYDDNLESEHRFPAFVMDLGQYSLSKYIAQQSEAGEKSSERFCLPLKVAVEVMRSMLSAVEALHGRRPRILHRDINPNNIICLYDGRWVLADFSLAKLIDSSVVNSTFSTSYTQKGWATSYFAPPEQIQYFKNTDEKADIYALGMLLWELFSPSWPPPQIEKSKLPEPLDLIFRRAANPEYDERYPSVVEFAKEFEHAAGLLDQG